MASLANAGTGTVHRLAALFAALLAAMAAPLLLSSTAQSAEMLAAPAMLAAASAAVTAVSSKALRVGPSIATHVSSPAGPEPAQPDDVLGACLGPEPELISVTYRPADGTFVDESGKAYFASDLHLPGQDRVMALDETEKAAAHHFAVPLGPENRWGEIPAWIVSGTMGAKNLLQAEQLERGLALFAPVHAQEACANALRRAEAAARQARAGAWGMAEPRLIFATAAPDLFAGAEGRYVIARGRVVSLGKTRSTRYLNFGKYWKTDFTVTLNASDEAAFDAALGRSGRTLDTLAGELVELRGYVQEQDGPSMALRYPEQLVVLDE
ncbi:hypothetical protein [Roseibium sp. M-1]